MFVSPSSLGFNYTYGMLLSMPHLTMTWAAICILNGKIFKHQGFYQGVCSFGAGRLMEMQDLDCHIARRPQEGGQLTAGTFPFIAASIVTADISH